MSRQEPIECEGWKVSVRHGAPGDDVIFDAVTDTNPLVRMTFRWSPAEAIEIANMLTDEASRRGIPNLLSPKAQPWTPSPPSWASFLARTRRSTHE